MKTQSEHPTDYEQTLDDAHECPGDIAELPKFFRDAMLQNF